MLGTLDHLSITLIDKRHKKLEKIGKKLLLIFPLLFTVIDDKGGKGSEISDFETTLKDNIVYGSP